MKNIEIGIATDQNGNKSAALNVYVSNPETHEVINCLMLWDTGANYSHISVEIFEKLKTKQIGERYTNIITNGKLEKVPIPVTNVKIRLASDIEFFVDTSVMDIDGYNGLIGMDIIKQGKFTVDISNNKCSFII